MADGRRIIFGTYVVAQEGEASEEGIPTKYIMLQQDTSGDAVGKTMGSKGIVLEAQMQSNQWSDSWTSMAHQHMNWEDWDDATDVSGNRWEDTQDIWDGESTVPTHPSFMQLTHGNAAATDKDLAFVYVKNTGSTQCFLSCVAGGASGYNIVIPPGGSVNFRGGSSAVHCDDIYVKTIAGTTTIEYVLATSEA